MGFFAPPCVHDPFMMDKTVLPSPCEQLSEEVKKDGAAIHELVEQFTNSNMFYQKVVVITLSCKKCGKVWSEKTALFLQSD